MSTAHPTINAALEEMHHIPPHIRSGRARAAAIMFIVSDIMSVFAILAAGGYLGALNVLNQFKVSGDHGPALLPGLLTAIVLVLSGLAYFFWARRASVNGGVGQPALYILAFVCIVLSLLGQTWVNLSLGYSAPYHAYESVIMLITWFTWVHFLLTSILGVLLLGRVLRGRLAGFEFIAEVAGYWWYYTVIASLLLWAFSLII